MMLAYDLPRYQLVLIYISIFFDGLLIYRSCNKTLVSDALGIYVAQNITIKILDVMTGYLNTTLSVEDI